MVAMFRYFRDMGVEMPELKRFATSLKRRDRADSPHVFTRGNRAGVGILQSDSVVD